MGYDNQGKWIGLGQGRGIDDWHPASYSNNKSNKSPHNSGSGSGCGGTIFNWLFFLFVMFLMSGLNC